MGNDKVRLKIEFNSHICSYYVISSENYQKLQERAAKESNISAGLLAVIAHEFGAKMCREDGPAHSTIYTNGIIKEDYYKDGSLTHSRTLKNLTTIPGVSLVP